MIKSLRILALVLTALVIGSPASAGKGLGPYYNMKYEDGGIIAADLSADGSVELTTQSISTINCGGCAEVWYGPGKIFHLRNTGKQPICAAFHFDPEDRGLDNWGSGTAYYLKGRQQLKKVGGFFSVATGGTEQVNLSMTGRIETWEPVGKKKC